MEQLNTYLLQLALGLHTDGKIGPRTQAAIKDFQSSKGLVSDGIVGPKTIEALALDQVARVYHYYPLDVHITRYPRTPKYIAIHFTAGSKSTLGSAQRLHGIFVSRKASADFGVDNGSIYQFNPDPLGYYCWAVGDKASKSEGGASLLGIAGNRSTVSIEICSTLKPGTSASHANHTGWSYTPEALENARILVRVLMEAYGIPLDRVVRHYDISGKLCPGVPGWNLGYLRDPVTGKNTGTKNNQDAWLEFKKSL